MNGCIPDQIVTILSIPLGPKLVRMALATAETETNRAVSTFVSLSIILEMTLFLNKKYVFIFVLFSPQKHCLYSIEAAYPDTPHPCYNMAGYSMNSVITWSCLGPGPGACL